MCIRDSYQISHDPTQGWMLATSVLMLAALAGSLTIKRRRLWIRLTPTATGTHVELAGLARTDRAGWGAEFDEIVEEILGVSEEENPSFEVDDLG